MNGIKPAAPSVVALENPFKHLNDMSLFNSEHIFSGHIGGHTTWEEELTHDEPYGYVRHDDPFEPHGKLDAPLIFLLLGGFIFIHFNFVHFNFLKSKPSTVWMHQRITAGMLEDRIREYREAGFAPLEESHD